MNHKRDFFMELVSIWKYQRKWFAILVFFYELCPKCLWLSPVFSVQSLSSFETTGGEKGNILYLRYSLGQHSLAKLFPPFGMKLCRDTMMYELMQRQIIYFRAINSQCLTPVTGVCGGRTALIFLSESNSRSHFCQSGCCFDGIRLWGKNSGFSSDLKINKSGFFFFAPHNNSPFGEEKTGCAPCLRIQAKWSLCTKASFSIYYRNTPRRGKEDDAAIILVFLTYFCPLQVCTWTKWGRQTQDFSEESFLCFTSVLHKGRRKWAMQRGVCIPLPLPRVLQK